MRRIALLATLLVVVATVSGLTHGGAPIFKGATWHEVLDKVPCQYVVKVGKDLKINATLVVDRKSYPNSTVTEPGVIDELDKRCFPKH